MIKEKKKNCIARGLYNFALLLAASFSVAGCQNSIASLNNTAVETSLPSLNQSVGDHVNEIESNENGPISSLDVKFFKKNIHGVTGAETYTETRVCTDYIVADNYDLVLTVDSSLIVFQFVYDLNEVSPLYNSGEWSNETRQVYPLLQGYRYRFVFEKTNQNLMETSYVSNNVTFELYELGTQIPDYYQKHLSNKISSINSQKANISNCLDSFVFVTDIHFLGNRLHSPALIKEIVKNTNTKMIVNGGDVASSASFITNTNKAENELRMWQRLMNDNEFSIRGNHDHDTFSNNSMIISHESFYEIMLKPLENKAVLDNKTYYYLDNDSTKIRYLFMDSGDTTFTALDDEQLCWMKNKMIELSSDWGVVIFQHMVLKEHLISSGVAKAELCNYGVTLKEAILDIKDKMSAELIAVVCGHAHCDYSLIEDGILFISTTCDQAETGNNSYDHNYPVRTFNTYLEQAFDVFIIDRKQKKLHIVRIGAGENREFDYGNLSSCV